MYNLFMFFLLQFQHKLSCGIYLGEDDIVRFKDAYGRSKD